MPTHFLGQTHLDGLDALDGVDVVTNVVTVDDHIGAIVTTCVRSESVT